MSSNWIDSIKSSSSDNVKVGIRIKPVLDKQSLIRNMGAPWLADHYSNKIQLDDQFQTTHRKPPFQAKFDHMITGVKNDKIYNSCIRELVDNCLEGYNGVVFAYGQTSSGKTYTMTGSSEEPGVIPQAVDHIFNHIKNAQSKEFLLRVSYMEIYNEVIRDLLQPESSDLRIMYNKLRGVFVSPMKEEIVTTPKQVMKVLEKGELNRHVNANDYHEHSSRSHTIFQILIETREQKFSKRRAFGFTKKTNEEDSSVKFSQLNLIDLAGSEKYSSNLERRKEASYINTSLLTLGTVISKLGDEKALHIPYRDSKLTRVLQTALSGNARISVVCTINPYGSMVDESINTLKFAMRVKKVPIKATKNQPKDAKLLIQKYKTEIEELKTQLNEATQMLEKTKKKEPHHSAASSTVSENDLDDIHITRTAYKERMDHLTKLILSSTSFTNKPSTQSRPMSVYMAPSLTRSVTKLTPMQKEKDRNLRHQNLLDDLKIKDRYIDELEKILFQEKNLSKAAYENFLMIKKLKDNWETDIEKQESSLLKEIENKVNTSLGRVASFRFSRSFNISGINLNDTAMLNGTDGGGGKANVLINHIDKNEHPSKNSQFTKEPSIDKNMMMRFVESHLSEVDIKEHPEYKEMEVLIEDLNQVIMELEKERKLQTDNTMMLKKKVKKLELEQLERVERDVMSKHRLRSPALQPADSTEKSLNTSIPSSTNATPPARSNRRSHHKAYQVEKELNVSERNEYVKIITELKNKLDEERAQRIKQQMTSSQLLASLQAKNEMEK